MIGTRKNHVRYVVAGKIEIDFEGKIEVLKQDYGLFIRSNAKHKECVKTETTFLFPVEDV